MAEGRTPETIRGELARERAGLAASVAALRRQLGTATDVRARIRSRTRTLAPAAFAAGFVVSGGIGASMRYLARRGRER